MAGVRYYGYCSNKSRGTRKTATDDIKAINADSEMIAACQALAYNTGRPVPF